MVESRNPGRRQHEPMVAFVQARLDEDEEGTSGDAPTS